MYRRILAAIAAGAVLVSGITGFALLEHRTNMEDLNRMVLSADELGEDFELTHETISNTTNYENSSIEMRVDRRFVDNKSTVILSSATVYSSKSAAGSVRTDFIDHTADNVTSADFGNGNIVKIHQRTLFKDVVYYYNQKGNLIYFVSVASYSGYEDGKAEELMKKMNPENLLTRFIS
ncbi:MAG: hypothetical protein ACI977_000745 [Candidatus Nanohaloarchaea archaeon]|jgi:hypothetical protein